MPTLDSPASLAIHKLLLIGDSGSGKTGALASLALAGYKLRILDFDCKVVGGILPHALAKDKAALGRVEYVPLRDRMKATAAGPVMDGVPQAYIKGLGLMEKWTDGSNPMTWGSDYILVLDSLTFFSDAAFNWAKSLNPSSKDPRTWFYSAQQLVESALAAITSSEYATNVIVIAHVSYQNRADGTMKGFPASVGTALGPTIPAYFENMALCTVLAGGKRTIQTVPTAMLDLKTPVAFKMAPSFPAEVGLAEFFKTLKT